MPALDGADRMTENQFVDKVRALLLTDDEERRAIERELHDGVQQQLVAVAVNLQVVRGLTETDLQEAARLIDDVRALVRQSLDDLRKLAQRIHPPLLDTQGLVAALGMAAASAPIPTRVEGTVEGAVPREVALTVYRCCVATLAAAAGERARAKIAVGARDRSLEFEITLAGGVVEIDALDALAGRVAVLDGALEITPARVAGRLPLTS
jgi:signal transduction histidine kinase